MIPQDLDSFLLDPAAYPEKASSIDLCETHISQVYLTPTRAYKRKKSIRLPFLDYSSLALRAEACRQELAVNQAFAPEIYLGLQWLYRLPDGGLTWQETPEKVEVFVLMKRFSAEDQLDQRLLLGRLSAGDRAQVEQTLARSLGATEKISLDLGVYSQLLEEHIRENAATLRDLSPDLGLEAEFWDVACHRQLMFLKLFPSLFEQRVATGWIRLGHGDLKPEHIVLGPAPSLVDAIEFDPSFRTIDLADEVSFLEVELQALEQASYGAELRNHLLAYWGDPVGGELLAFYRTYRACVRAKVLGLRALQLPRDQREEFQKRILRYQDLAAASLAEMMPPVLCFVSGPMGSGKSFLASHLAEATQTLLLESDRVRRELYGPSDSLLAYGQGRYRELDRKQVYQRMCEQAREQLARGRSVLVDASFDSPSFWQIFRSDPIFERYPVAMLVCRCREAVAVDRIERRRETMGVLSDARTDLYQKQMERCTWEFDTRYAKPVDTEQSIEALLEESLSFIGEQVWHFLHRRR